MTEPSHLGQSEARYRAWIVYPDGRKFGPFESLYLANQVRVYVEQVEQRTDLWIKTEGELRV